MASGDSAAIESFYRRFFEPMLRMARTAVPSRRRDESFALDIVHDAMLRIVRCIRPIETEQHLTNWTRLVVQSCALDRLRQEQRRERREKRSSECRTPAANLGEEVDWLQHQIARLEPRLAEMMTLRFAEGWTLARIAANFRTTTGQVDGQLRRAIGRLREQAREAFDE